jgi:hypothetical protein
MTYQIISANLASFPGAQPSLGLLASQGKEHHGK